MMQLGATAYLSVPEFLNQRNRRPGPGLLSRLQPTIEMPKSLPRSLKTWRSHARSGHQANSGGRAPGQERVVVAEVIFAEGNYRQPGRLDRHLARGYLPTLTAATGYWRIGRSDNGLGASARGALFLTAKW